MTRISRDLEKELEELENSMYLDDINNSEIDIDIDSNSSDSFLNIAVDFDDVIVPLMKYFIYYCKNILNIDINIEDVESPIFSEILKCENDHAKNIFDKFVESDYWNMLHSNEPDLDCKNKLIELKKIGHKLYIVTAREHRFKNITEDYINKYLPNIFDSIHFGNHYGNNGIIKKKSEICKDLGCHILIDDNPNYISDALNNKINGILLGEWKWSKIENVGPINSSNKIHKISNWKDIDIDFHIKL